MIKSTSTNSKLRTLTIKFKKHRRNKKLLKLLMRIFLEAFQLKSPKLMNLTKIFKRLTIVKEESKSKYTC